VRTTRRMLLARSAKAFTPVAGGFSAREMLDNAVAATTLKTTGKTADTEITRSGSQPSAKGPEQFFFTGSVRIDAQFKGSGEARVGGATVAFEPGVRTAWHTHPLGQTLLVTGGSAACTVRVGRLRVSVPEKHWHGAAPDCSMTHIGHRRSALRQSRRMYGEGYANNTESDNRMKPHVISKFMPRVDHDPQSLRRRDQGHHHDLCK
jgi:quercetin dioxygenase-like cupin family protein